MSDPRASRGASLLLGGYLQYRGAFRVLTLKAADRFAARDWASAQRDSVERHAAYRRGLDKTLAKLRSLWGDDVAKREPWRQMKAAYLDLAETLPDLELAETFFNSATRRVFATVGIDPEIEFVSPVTDVGDTGEPSGETERFAPCGSLAALLATALAHHLPRAGFADLAGDLALAAEVIRRQVPDADAAGIELVKSPFYRGQGAYVIGRLLAPAARCPVVFAFTHPEGPPAGARLDAVLLSEDEVSIVFSFTRSYFFVDCERPRELVRFLKSIMPRKPVGELYNSIGHNKHGKTELYRALLHHLETTDDRFEIARGERGMVMVVFDLPGFDSVFKVIRDRFDYPKSTTRAEVMAKYRLVFEHDRAGRLVDAQEFEHLAFDRRRFSDELLAELAAKVSGTVRIGERQVDIAHVYTERRLTPLDVYLREASPADADAAILDFGETLRDLAATDIFPGDMLLKNFGATRHKRVVFYDYDELCRVTDSNFRDLPEPSSDEEETAGEAWFYVDEKDIFPEEFLRFLGLRGSARERFLAAHGDLLTSAYWRNLRTELLAGRLFDVLPYPAARRLRRD